MTLHFNPIGYVAIAAIGLACAAFCIPLFHALENSTVPTTIGAVLLSALLVFSVTGTIWGEHAWYDARHPMTGCIKQRLWVLLQDDRGTPVPVVTTDQWRWNCPD